MLHEYTSRAKLQTTRSKDLLNLTSDLNCTLPESAEGEGFLENSQNVSGWFYHRERVKSGIERRLI